ncbi:MAG TPA: hypothetical protein DCZ03_07270, partial [Gammaproteobacteria bacterium]|nr:hypothetical protein [Gammaproteobacteria bacterium]
NEPFLNFLVDLTWPAGRLQREFTVLLDPPVFSEEGAPLEARLAEESAAQPGPSATADQNVDLAGELYGPVLENQTLWSIATEVRPDDSVSVYQSMMALLEANPHAFINNNVNELKRGEVLRIPSAATFKAMSRSEAHQEFVRQNSAWESNRITSAQSAPQAPLTTSKPETPLPSGSGGAVTGPQLELIVPKVNESLEQAGGSGADAATENGADGSSLAQEAMDAVVRENDELRSRILDLESQIQNMEALIQLRSEQLVELESQAIEEPQVVEQAPANAPELATNEAEQATAQEPEPTGLVDSIAENRTLFLLGALLLLALVAVGLRFLKGRQEAAEDYVEFESEEPDAGTMIQEHTSAAKGVLEQADELVEQDQQAAAQKLLKEHLEMHPDDHDARTRLIEIYYDAGNIHMFVSEAERLHSLIVGTQYSGWNRVQALGLEVAPEHWLFAETTDTHDTGSTLQEGQFHVEHHETDTELMDGLDTGIVSDEEPLNMNQDLEAPASLLAGSTTKQETVDPELEAKAFAELTALDEEGDLGILELTDDESAFQEEVATEDEGEDSFGADNFSTQLDLATTYIEMEDFEGAEELIREVLKEGDEKEKEEAESLMERLKATNA